MSSRRHQISSAFTLIEVMISIVLVLLLILGINQAFKLTSEAVGAGQSTSAKVRDATAAQGVIQQELGRLAVIANGEPFLFISSQARPAFRNRQDEQIDQDYDPAAHPSMAGNPPSQAQLQALQTYWQNSVLTIDVDNNNQEGEAPSVIAGERISAATYNYRNHRQDLISFFARGFFQRQTGNDPGMMPPTYTSPSGGGTHQAAPASYAANQSSPEAWITYGPLWQPNNNATWEYFMDGNLALLPTYPGMGTSATNPNNFYAVDWNLGRNAILLLPRTELGPPPAPLYDKNGQVVTSIDTPRAPGPGVYPGTISHFATSSSDPPVTNPGSPRLLGYIYSSRYDVAMLPPGGSMATMRSELQQFIAANALAEWWDQIIGGSGGNPLLRPWLFQCNPKIGKPISPTAAAQAAPAFLGNCSQFIVEYAGDYLKQNRDQYDNVPTGAGDAAGRFGDAQDVYWDTGAGIARTDDGEIDFVVEQITPPGSTIPLNVRRIRWYGMPRDTDGVAGIPGFKTGMTASQLNDVLPLRDLWRTIVPTPPITARAPFERTISTVPLTRDHMPSRDDYANPTQDVVYGTNTAAGMNSFNRYVCAWGPDSTAHRRPKMLRIIMTVEDPNGRLPEGQTYEYIINLGQ